MASVRYIIVTKAIESRFLPGQSLKVHGSVEGIASLLEVCSKGVYLKLLQLLKMHHDVHKSFKFIYINPVWYKRAIGQTSNRFVSLR
jgi:hypothetical protein